MGTPGGAVPCFFTPGRAKMPHQITKAKRVPRWPVATAAICFSPPAAPLPGGRCASAFCAVLSLPVLSRDGGWH